MTRNRTTVGLVGLLLAGVALGSNPSRAQAYHGAVVYTSHSYCPPPVVYRPVVVAPCYPTYYYPAPYYPAPVYYSRPAYVGGGFGFSFSYRDRDVVRHYGGPRYHRGGHHGGPRHHRGHRR